MPQNPDNRFVPDDDERFTPDSEPQSSMPPAEPGFLSKVYHAVSDPLTTAPSRLASHIVDLDKADNPDVGMKGDNSWSDTFKKLKAQMAGGNQGSLQAVGNLVSGLSSPANIAMTAATMGGNLAANAGYTGVANALSLATKAAAAPGMIHGSDAMLSPDSTWQERLQGGVELAGNAAGALHEPTARYTPPSEVKPNTVTPEPTHNVPADHGIDPIDKDFFSHVGPDRSVPKGPETGSVVEPPNSGENPLFREHYARQRAARQGQTPIVSPEVPPEFTQSIAPNLPPEFQPITQSGERFNGGQDVKTPEQLQYELAQNKFNMSREMPDEMRSSSVRPPFDEQVLGQAPEGFDNQGVGRRFPAQTANDIGDINQPIDLNNAALNMGSDMAKPVNPSFGDQVLGPSDEINFSQVGPDRAISNTGEVKIGADVKSLGEILGSSLYGGNIRTIATKELLQNSIDAIRHVGPAGKIHVLFDNKQDTLHVTDNGKGMTPNEIGTILTDLGSSGKRNDNSAIGGFGLAKASFLLGGEHVEVSSVARDTKTGKIIKTELRGSPDDLLSGVQPTLTEMPPNTPLGTSIKVKVPHDENGGGFYDARRFVENVSKHSEFPGEIHMSSGYGDYLPDPTPLEKFNGAKTLGKVDAAGGSVHLMEPEGVRNGETSTINLMMRNNGMYQGTHQMYLGEQAKVPDSIIVDVNSKVPEGHGDYPFTANRESLRGTVQKDVEKWIQDNLVDPAKGERATQLRQAYTQMPTVETRNGLTLKYFDTGSRYTPEEFMQVQNSPAMHDLGEHIDDAIGTLKHKFAGEKWADRLEHIGFVFDDKLRGVHIPNPGSAKSMILINPLQLMENLPPDEAAAGFAHVILHEFAHVDPNMGRGHNESFTTNLANIYEKFGARETVRTQDAFLKSVAPDGTYTPEISDLLQRYSESRGRPIVKEDVLSGTGVGSATSSGGPTGIPEGSGTNAAGTSPERTALDNAPLGQTIIVRKERFTPNFIKSAQEAGFKYIGENDQGNFRFKKTQESSSQPILEHEVAEHRPTQTESHKVQPPPDPTKASPLMDLYQAPRTIMASGDLSGPLRQGLGLIHKKAFWTSLKPMFDAWRSEDAYQASQQAIMERPLFRERAGPGGKVLPSFAQDAGLKLTDLKDMSTREESFVSQIAEKLPGVRRSGRSYTAFLNNLRADTFESIIKDSKMFGVDAKVNVPLAREIANFVNIASGRGSLGSLEQAAVPLGHVLFAPRLIAARLQMMNPAYYIMASPQVRQEALKSLFAIAAVGNTITTLGRLAGGEVSMNPTSPDFGKLKIGNTRLDPYGGFQQYIVAATRLMTGTVTSSTTGNEYDLNNPQGPYDPTHADIATRFIRGKMHPVLGFAWSLMSGKKEMSGEPMNFSTPNPMENAVAQRFIPILAQDMYQLAQDPDMPPGIKALEGALATFGMGQQTYGPPQ
jgi:hypothetical protein